MADPYDPFDRTKDVELSPGGGFPWDSVRGFIQRTLTGPSAPLTRIDDEGRPIAGTQVQTSRAGSSAPSGGTPGVNQTRAAVEAEPARAATAEAPPPPSRGVVIATELMKAGYVEVADGVWLNPLNGDTIDLNKMAADAARGYGFSDGGRQFAPQAISAEVDPITGEVLWIDPNTRTIQRSGQFVGIEPKQIIDPRSGRLLVVTPDGKVTDTGSQVGFADIDPEREFVEGQRQFDEGERGATDRTRINDTGATTRTGMQETGANQRAGLTAQVQGFQSINQLAPQLATAAVNNAEFTRDTLRQPQDYVARAHFQRGATSPLPEVSQADVINKLRSNISGFNDTLAGFQGFNPVVAAPPITAPVQAAAVAPPAAAPARPPAVNLNDPVFAGFAAMAAQQGKKLGQFKDGGFTDAPLMLVGEEGPELVANPKRGPLAIADAETTEKIGLKVPGFASGTGWLGALNAAQEAMNDPVRQAEIVNAANESAWSGNAGFASTQADDWDDDYSPAPPPPPPPPPVTTLAPPIVTAQPAPFQFQPPQLPVAAPVTQDELRATERSVRPPGVNDVLSGRSPSPLRFKRPLFTPMQFGQLTPDEQTALGTSLALDNESLDDYKTAMMQRFVAPQTRGRAAFVGGFA